MVKESKRKQLANYLKASPRRIAISRANSASQALTLTSLSLLKKSKAVLSNPSASLVESQSLLYHVLAQVSMLTIETDDSLFIIHSPFAVGDGSGSPDQLVEAWKIFEELKNDGLLKSIGVSNFRPQDIQALLEKCEYKPAVNQIEFHPQVLAHLEPLIELQRKHAIVTEAYGPLSPFRCNKGSRLDPILYEIAGRLSEACGKDIDESMVLLLWCKSRQDVVVITTSSDEGRIRRLAGAVFLHPTLRA